MKVRAAVLAVLRMEPITGPEAARLAGVTPKQAADALGALYMSEWIAREGRKAGATWRLLTPAESIDAARRRARSREPGPRARDESRPPTPEGGA